MLFGRRKRTDAASRSPDVLRCSFCDKAEADVRFGFVAEGAAKNIGGPTRCVCPLAPAEQHRNSLSPNRPWGTSFPGVDCRNRFSVRGCDDAKTFNAEFAQQNPFCAFCVLGVDRRSR